MEFDQLRTFLAVVEHGSFSKAAIALHFSQSTLSFHMRTLETALGTELLTRGRNGCRPTAAGERLRDYAARILAIHEDATRAVRNVAQGIEGTLSLAVSTVPGEYLLPAVLAKFKLQFPDIHIEMRQWDSHGALSALRSRLCDIAVMGSKPTSDDLVLEALTEDEIVLVGKPSIVEPALTATQRGDAHEPSRAKATLILRESGSGTRATVWEVIEALPGFEPNQIDTMIVGSTESARRCALAGLGWAFVSRLAVQQDLDRGDLVPFPLADLPIRRTFWAATLPPTGSSNPIAHRFFTFLVQFFR